MSLLLALLAAASAAAETPPRAEGPPAGMVEVDGRLFPDLGPLPPMPHPPENPPTPAKIALGEKLFFDPILSGDRKLACATCHVPERDFQDDLPLAVSRGKTLKRRTRALKNVGYNRTFFWDGRASTLEEALFFVLRNPKEMDLDPDEAVRRLAADPDYRRRFEEAFGARGVSTVTLSHAIAAYERTLVYKESTFDMILRGDSKVMAGATLNGLALFKGKARCIVCHNGPTLSDGKLHDTGLRGSRRLSKKSDGRFRTPMLRNSSVNTPYFHHGSIGDIEEMIAFYDRGGDAKDDLDPDLKPLGLTPDEKLELKSFLYSLAEYGVQRKRIAGVEHELSTAEKGVYERADRQRGRAGPSKPPSGAY